MNIERRIDESPKQEIDKEYHGTCNKMYRKAILQALEESRDFQSRSNLDAIRRFTCNLLTEQQQKQQQQQHNSHNCMDNNTSHSHSHSSNNSNTATFKWNDAIFLRTLKLMAEDHDIDFVSSNCIVAELSPSYKRKRTDSIVLSQQHNMFVELESNNTVDITDEAVPDANHDSTMIEHSNTSLQPQSVTATTMRTRSISPKEAPHRAIEHDKWKIIPKKIYDKADFD